MSNVLYSKLRLEVSESLDGSNAIITSGRGVVRTVVMSSPITDIMLAGMEKYRVQAGDMDEYINLGYGQIKTLRVSDIYSTVKNATSAITRDQWLEFVNEGCIALVVEKGEKTSFIGKTVILPNAITPTYSFWTIADFNHDSSGNTCDLVQQNVIYRLKFGASQLYGDSDIRRWLTVTFYNGFIDAIKSKLQLMSVPCSGSSGLNDKVKLLSATEINQSSAAGNIIEGNRYPIFTDDASRVRTGVRSEWFLRTRYKDNVNFVWAVLSDGTIGEDYYTNSQGIVPVIRFA